MAFSKEGNQEGRGRSVGVGAPKVPKELATETAFRVAFVCGKLGDVDGVSLEVGKWVSVCKRLGHEVFAIAGTFVSEVEGVEKKHHLSSPHLRFDSSLQRRAEQLFFPHMSSYVDESRHEERKALLETIKEQGVVACKEIFRFIKHHQIDVLIAENTNAMPMSLVGALAVHHLAIEYKMAVIFHHHDFWWERSRFSGNYIETFLNQIIPPADPEFEHVVISSYAAHNLRSIKHVIPHVIPNCEDFSNPPQKDAYNSHFRSDFGFTDDDILFLQPTRIVPRKRIEDSIHLVHLFCCRYPEMRKRVHFLISLYQGDEPDRDYIKLITHLAEKRNIPIHFISDCVGASRSINEKGRRIYSPHDILVNADFVTYLPIWEGFGNALLESVAAKVPLVVATYLVYKTDIMGRGLSCIEVRDEYDEKGNLIIPSEVLTRLHSVLVSPSKRRHIVENNFRCLSKIFGFQILEKRLATLFDAYGDEIRASRSRLSRRRASFSV